MIKDEWKPMKKALKENKHNDNPFNAKLKGEKRKVKRLDTKHQQGEYNSHGCYIYPEVWRYLFEIEGYGKVTLCYNVDDSVHYLEPAKDFHG